MRLIRSESSEEKSVVAWAKANDLLAVKLFRVTGLPDRVFLGRRGRLVFVEMKRSKAGVVSRMQTYIHGLLRERGFIVLVCHGAAEAKAALADWIAEAPWS